MGKLHRARSQGSLLAIVKKANFDPKNNKRPGVDLYNGRVEVDKHRVVFCLLQGAEWIGKE